MNANANADDSAGTHADASVNENMTASESGNTETVASESVPNGKAEIPLLPAMGQLHADIVSLRVLYRRLAEQAGVDLTDFTLDGLVLPLVPEQPSHDELSQLNTVMEELQASSVVLRDWYRMHSSEATLQLSGPVVMRGSLSSGFGWRTSPKTGERRLHKGVDYRGSEGEPILALADGVVSFAGRVHAYGNMVELLHADGFRTRYAHNQANSVVRGQRVQQGQIIARLGSTGRSTGPHVHVEVHLDGEALDPMLFFP